MLRAKELSTAPFTIEMQNPNPLPEESICLNSIILRLVTHKASCLRKDNSHQGMMSTSIDRVLLVAGWVTILMRLCMIISSLYSIKECLILLVCEFQSTRLTKRGKNLLLDNLNRGIRIISTFHQTYKINSV